MSRPQFETHSSYPRTALPTGPVVNGGLIDFQDNFYRGVTQSELQAMHAFQNPAPVMGGPMLAGMPPHSTLLGPPNYIKVAGTVYRPVEEAPVPVVAEPAKPVVQAAPEPPKPRPITAKDVDRHVQKRLEEWEAARSASRTSSMPGRSQSVKGRSRNKAPEEIAAERVRGAFYPSRASVL